MKRLWLLIAGHEGWRSAGDPMVTQVLLLLLLLVEARAAEAAVAPDDDDTALVWKLQMTELKGKGETGKRKKLNKNPNFDLWILQS